MEMTLELLRVFTSLQPSKEGFCTFYAYGNKIQVNCDNEFFIEYQSSNGVCISNEYIATDHESLMLMCHVFKTWADTDGRIMTKMIICAQHNCHLREVHLGGHLSKAQFQIRCINGEELSPPELDKKIPFVNIHREDLRKAFNLLLYATNQSQTEFAVRLYLLPGEMIIQSPHMRISLGTNLHQVYEGAYIEFTTDAIAQLVRFLGSIHHGYVKLHLHKDLIFRMIAQNPTRSRIAIKSNATIILYCGHGTSI